MSDFDNFKKILESAGFPVEIVFDKENDKKASILLLDENSAIASQFVFEDGDLKEHYGYVDWEVV